MKLPVVVVCLVMAWILQGTAVAQEWSSWASTKQGVEYRWVSATSPDGATCHLQLRDPQRQVETIAGIRVEYKYDNQDESTRDVVTIMNVGGSGEYLGERTIHHCASVGELHVTGILRQ